MTSSRIRSLIALLAVFALILFLYFSWTLSSSAIIQSPFLLTLITTAITGFNIAILFAWVGFGMLGGITVTLAALFLVMLLDFRMGHSAHHIFMVTFLVTAGMGYFFTRSRSRLNQLHILRMEKIDEEINILVDKIRERNTGIRVLEEKLMKYSVLRDVTESLSTVLSIDDIAVLVLEKTLKVLGKKGRVLIYLADQGTQELMLRASSAKNEAVIKEKKGDAFDHWVLRHRKSLIVEDVKRDFRFSVEGIEQARGVFSSLIATSLISENKVIGIIRVDSPEEFKFSQDDLRLLDIIANLAAVAIQNAMLYSRTQEMAIIDGLTGLKSRRFFMERLHREVKRAARKKEHLSLVMLDIDRFKEYNDRYGHTAGDLILQSLSRMITELLDEADVAGRYGGEEIAVLFWGKDKEDATRNAEKIRRLIKDNPITLKNQAASVTVSIGIATFPEDAITEGEMIRVADIRLYKAKAEGRDRICSS